MKALDKIRLLLNYRKYLEHSENNIKFSIKENDLTRFALTSTEQGISQDKYFEEDVIVSLTTYGKRLYDVYLTIESIMQGSLKPNKIILWLSDDMKDVDLPLALQKQMRRGLEIKYCKDYRSYTKIIPTLISYPKDIIITIDDDMIYNFDLVENLINSYKRDKKSIHSNRMHRMKLDKDNNPLKYHEWDWCVNDSKVSNMNFLTGVGGVLYPPQSLDKEVLNEDVFLDICKYADDIWLYAMALRNGTPIKKSFTHSNKGEDYLENQSVQDCALVHKNLGGGTNDSQLKAVLEKYDLIKLLIK